MLQLTATQRGELAVKIDDIANGMKHVNIEGRIVNMNGYMLVVDDDSGRAFVRYSRRNLETEVTKGSHVKIRGCRAVVYSGILELKMNSNGYISLAKG